VKIRAAAAADIPRISAVMRESMASLGARFYDERQTRSAVEHIAIVDPQLIDDGTYYVVEEDAPHPAFGHPLPAPRGEGTSVEALLPAARGEGTRSADEGHIIACGGWSRRAKLFTGTGSNDARALDPEREPARVRAMFVAPGHARRGIGRMILDRCESAARDAQFKRVELMATLPGEPLYSACGYTVIERVELTLPDGVTLPCAKMEKML
jgi:GNAT superfamily N-acetyltransferase